MLGVVLLAASACNSSGDGLASRLAGEVVIDLKKTDNRRLLSFYIGGMVGAEARDPFRAGVLREEKGDFFLHVDSLAKMAPILNTDLRLISADGLVDWDELEALVLTHYYAYRNVPATVDLLMAETGDWNNEGEWFRVDVNGVMSPHLRQINVKLKDLYDAIRSYRENGDHLIYPVGTIFISEHLDADHIVELSAMRKRHDGFWDFFAYNENGFLASALTRHPKNLDVPTKCIGCHFGTRLFEPERSFPSKPQPGPDGPRALYFDYPPPGRELIRSLDEHRKRSDLVLGLYGTLMLAKLRNLKQEGSLGEEEADVLGSIGF